MLMTNKLSPFSSLSLVGFPKFQSMANTVTSTSNFGVYPIRKPFIG